MAVTLGNTSSGTTGPASPDPTLTVSHTVAAGSNRCLFVTAYSRNETATCTYNGVAMTEATKNQFQGNLYLFYLVAPATGAHNIVLSTTNVQTSNMMLQGVDFSDVNQVTPFDSVANNGKADPSLTFNIDNTVTTINTNTYIVGGVSSENEDAAISAISGQTSFGEETTNDIDTAGGYEQIASPGSELMRWAINNPAGDAVIAMAVLGAIAENTTSPSASPSVSVSPSISKSPSASPSPTPSSSISKSPSASQSPSSSLSSSISRSPSPSSSPSSSVSASISPSSSPSSSASASPSPVFTDWDNSNRSSSAWINSTKT